MSTGKMLGLSIIAFMAIMVVIGIFGYPNTWNIGGTFSGLSPTVALLVPTILILFGGFLIIKKSSAGWPLIMLGLVTIWLGTNNVTETGNNIGISLRETTSGLADNGPLPTTGKIVLERKFGNPTVFALGDEYRRIDLPPGTELCADPQSKVELRADSTSAVKYVRSKDGQVVHVNFYFMLYGHSCVLLPPTQNQPGRRTQTQTAKLTKVSKAVFLYKFPLSWDIQSKSTGSNI